MKKLIESLKQKHYLPISRVIIIIFLMFLIVLVGSGVTGFTTSLIDIQKLASNSTQTQLVIGELEERTEQCTKTLNMTSLLFSNCRIELKNREISNVLLLQEVDMQERNITIYKNNITVLRRDVESFKQLTNDFAGEICCVRKYVLKDESLRYYYIQDNKTFCTSLFDESLKTKEFFC